MEKDSKNKFSGYKLLIKTLQKKQEKLSLILDKYLDTVTLFAKKLFSVYFAKNLKRLCKYHRFFWEVLANFLQNNLILFLQFLRNKNSCTKFYLVKLLI